MKTPERSVEEIMNDWDYLIKVSTKLELRQWLTQTLQAERQRCDEMVEASYVKGWDACEKTEIPRARDEERERIINIMKENRCNCGHCMEDMRLDSAIDAIQPNNPK